MDYGSFAYFIQFGMENPLKAISLPMKHNLKSKMLFKQLMMHFMANLCNGLVFVMNWYTILNANVISAFVATIVYMINLRLFISNVFSSSILSHLYLVILLAHKIKLSM